MSLGHSVLTVKNTSVQEPLTGAWTANIDSMKNLLKANSQSAATTAVYTSRIVVGLIQELNFTSLDKILTSMI